MKVLYFLDTVNRGGAETQAIDICRNAKDYGIEITVAAGEGDLFEELRDTGVDVVPIHRKLPIDFSLIAKLREEIGSRGIQIVHSYQAVEGLHLYLAARRMSTVRQVMSFQGFVPDVKNRLALRFLIPRMDVNLYVSRGLQEWIERVDGLDTGVSAKVLYNGADPARLRPSGRSVKGELGIEPDAVLVGMVGNFYRDPRKDQMTLARALPSVFAAHPNAACLFIGKTEAGAEHKLDECRRICSEAGIEDRVYFLGGRSDVPDILAALDVFVLSSLQEGLPVALTEAMLAGIAAVVSDIPPHKEATADGRVGLLFRTGDDTDLAGKLNELMESRKLREDLAEKAKAHAQAHFSISAHLNGLHKIYSDLLREGGRL
jgi:glycosyltransferase involved in cell wall biosynthesis